jgi:hypothetical protein
MKPVCSNQCSWQKPEKNINKKSIFTYLYGDKKERTKLVLSFA